MDVRKYTAYITQYKAASIIGAVVMLLLVVILLYHLRYALAIVAALWFCGAFGFAMVYGLGRIVTRVALRSDYTPQAIY